jgi:hypothetical protein
MATTVQTRPNHYMTLGLTPAASEQEIADAYAREIILSRVRAFGATTQVSVAYETLRDPAKRKAYDEAIGVKREPAAAHLPRAVSFRSSAHFISGPPPIEPKADLPPPQPIQREPKASPLSEAEAPPEPRIAPFLAEALRRPEPAPAAAPVPAREPEVPRFLQSRPSLPSLEEDAEETGFNWKQPVVIVGALVGVVALVGAWAGVQAGNDVESSQPAVTIPVPSAKAAPVAAATTAAEPAAPTPHIAFERPAPRPRATPRRAERAETAPVAQTASGPFEQVAESGAVEAAPALTEDAPAEAESATASLPMSKATIARTIAKIGYPCGQVASTSQVLGNVYKVTCTSGDSYRAAPVHGRYRFKRL